MTKNPATTSNDPTTTKNTPKKSPRDRGSVYAGTTYRPGSTRRYDMARSEPVVSYVANNGVWQAVEDEVRAYYNR